ncbi:MAG TPA: DinB family protein [Candidatus Sulfotelmatobacter sp.]|nr:DinB family protein [Candidatus Sulfotelmatobacter sp.]
MTLHQFFLKQKEAIRARSRDVFAMLRPEHMSWRPEDGALNVGELLRHMWVSEEGVRRCALSGDFTYYEIRVPRGLHAVMGTPGTLDEEIRTLERVHRETVAEVSALSEAAFDEERSNAELGFRRKVAVILFGINEHEIHHRAQLMTYLRMLGTPVALKLAKK